MQLKTGENQVKNVRILKNAEFLPDIVYKSKNLYLNSICATLWRY